MDHGREHTDSATAPARAASGRRRDGRGRLSGAVLVLAALVGSFLLVAPVAPAAAQDAGHRALPDAMPGDRLLLTHRAASGAFEVHSTDGDAGDRTVLTSGASDFAPVWSPDGRHVAFHRVERPTDGVHVVSSDGGTTTRVADLGHSPSWSPDSTRLVHSPSLEADPVPLRIATLDGASTPVPGTTGGVEPLWSPDGAWIAYLQPPGQELVVVRPDGSERRVVAADAFDHDWSPDSTQLAYVTGGREGGAGEPPSRLVVVRRDGSGARALAESARVLQPTFSPSGRDLAFSARTPGGSLDLWRVELAGGTRHRLTDSEADDLHPTWAAGGSTLAFSRRASLDLPDSPSDVFSVDSLGGREQRVTDTGRDTVAGRAPGLTVRLAGADRVKTAVELSRTFEAADTVVIARADDPADALAGGPLAAALEAPLLLTGRVGLHPSLAPELRRLGVDRVYALGGHDALSPQLEVDLADALVSVVVRLRGADRFATAAAVADQLRAVAGAPDRVFVAEGQHEDPARGWPDSLSAAGLAGLRGEPVLLVTRDRLPQATVDAVTASGADRAVVVGGTGAVSAGVQARLGEHVAVVERVAGADRYETSALLADHAVRAGADAGRPWLATGRDWPDALAAAPAAVRDGGVLLLVDGGTWRLPTSVDAWLSGVEDPQRAVVVGGAGAVRPDTRTSIESALTAGP